MDSAALLADTHARVLRLLADATGLHFQGLAQASRHKSLPLTSKQRRQLLQLDVAANWARHITSVKCADFIDTIAVAVRSNANGVNFPEGCQPVLPANADVDEEDGATSDSDAGSGSASEDSNSDSEDVSDGAMPDDTVANFPESQSDGGLAHGAYPLAPNIPHAVARVAVKSPAGLFAERLSGSTLCSSSTVDVCQELRQSISQSLARTSLREVPVHGIARTLPKESIERQTDLAIEANEARIRDLKAHVAGLLSKTSLKSSTSSLKP